MNSEYLDLQTDCLCGIGDFSVAFLQPSNCSLSLFSYYAYRFNFNSYNFSQCRNFCN